MSAPVMLPLALLDPHPQNPRLVPRDDVIEQICAGLAEGFDPAHALIVRPLGGRYQVCVGHHRREAAIRVGLSEVPCWIRDLDDDQAYMLLRTSNAQGELSALERGMHALHSGIEIKAYAASIGRPHQTVYDEVYAAEVAGAVPPMRNELTKISYKTLGAIHVAPRWLWPALVSAMLAQHWTVEHTRAAVGRLKDISYDAPEWVNDSFIEGLVNGTIPAKDLRRIDERKDYTAHELQEIERQRAALVGDDSPGDGFGRTTLLAAMADDHIRFSNFSDALDYLNKTINDARRHLTAVQQEHAKKQRVIEQTRQRAAELQQHISLEEWGKLDEETKAALLPPDAALVSAGQFDKQDKTALEWAMWSWNPITGCEHNCPYCYAREIVTSRKFAKVYPSGFAPALRPHSLLTPRKMKLPPEAEYDTRYRNVFVGSMADIYGPWVPTEWIEAVLSEIRNAPAWNFLCLTKFPERMAEFDIPPNMWMGTTVDLQVRVSVAEEAFAKISSKVKWLACEPLLQQLRFQHMGRFDWMVIGGAMANKQGGTPEWRPPFQWIADLVQQARDAGVRVYFTKNLLGNRVLELPFDAPIEVDPTEAPTIFHYLNQP